MPNTRALTPALLNWTQPSLMLRIKSATKLYYLFYFMQFRVKKQFHLCIKLLNRDDKTCVKQIFHCLRLHPLTSIYLCTLWEKKKKKKSCVIRKGPALYMLRNSQKWVSAEVTALLPFVQWALSPPLFFFFYFRGLYYIILCVAVGW